MIYNELLIVIEFTGERPEPVSVWLFHQEVIYV